MAQEPQEQTGEVEIETPVGKLKTKGYHLGNVLQIVAAVLLALMAMMVYEMRADTKSAAAVLSGATEKSALTLAAKTKEEHDRLGIAIDKLAEQQEITNFLFTLSPAEREKLNLSMPEGLRRRIR